MAFITFQPSDNFNTKLYTGNGSTNAQTGIGFLPSWTWIKNRGDTHAHVLVDAVRGVTKELRSSGTNAEGTTTNSFTSFDSDGFTLGADNTDSYNKNSNNYVSWNWKVGGAGSANTDGAISSTVSVNSTTGISIVKYTGGGSASTVGHGLGAVPKIVLIKDLTSANAWRMYTEMTGNQSQLSLNQFDVADSGNTAMWNSTSPTSSVFSIGTHGNVSTSGSNYIAYCFKDIKGFSKFGKITANGSATAPPFIYTGFEPAFVMVKIATTGGSDDGGWVMVDNKRYPNNLSNSPVLFANLTNVESDSYNAEFMSNGFRFMSSSVTVNGTGNTYIYLAFAKNSIVASNGTPATAR